MPIIKNGELITDQWVSLDDDDPAPEKGAIIVSVSRWLKERVSLQSRHAPVGVWFQSSDTLEDVAGDISGFEILALEFPAFTDGRAYSTARTLRDKFAFKGEIRAVGNVLRDQWSFMNRCGFDAFEVDETTTLSAFKDAISEMDDQYQPASDDRTPAFNRARG
ncbi:MAG: DUF934 domain-containing protein [Alphaproteobacteria bacterium]|jgi:uncharacterized protein (DUF934 family)